MPLYMNKKLVIIHLFCWMYQYLWTLLLTYTKLMIVCVFQFWQCVITSVVMEFSFSIGIVKIGISHQRNRYPANEWWDAIGIHVIRLSKVRIIDLLNEKLWLWVTNTQTKLDDKINPKHRFCKLCCFLRVLVLVELLCDKWTKKPWLATSLFFMLILNLFRWFYLLNFNSYWNISFI